MLGETVPFGNDLIFEATDVRGLSIHVEVCEDLWVPLPPSTFGALAGATVLANLSASNITVGKSDFRHTLVGGQSARCIAAYIYTAAGRGESTTDLAWDGQAMIYENGDLVDEAERFSDDEQLLFADIDLDRMLSDRSSTNSFGDSIADHKDRLEHVPPHPVHDRAGRSQDAAAAQDRTAPVRAGRPQDPQRALLRGLQHPGPRDRDADARDRHREGRDRRLRRPGLHARADRAGPRDGSPRPAAREHPRLHDAGLRHVRPHQGQRLEADGGARHHRARDRHPPERRADAQGPRAPVRARREGLRHHVRERPGRRAHLAPVPARQLRGRPRDRHGRPVASSRSGGARTASATRCRTTRSTRPCPRR